MGEKRCELDPMVRLLHSPKGHDLEFIDLIAKVISKRYGMTPLLERIFGLLRSIEDHDARFMAIMAQIYWEPTVRTAVEQLYLPGSLYDVSYFRHFVNFSLGEFIPMTLKFHFNKTNIMETMVKFKISCRIAYMMGHLPPN